MMSEWKKKFDAFMALRKQHYAWANYAKRTPEEKLAAILEWARQNNETIDVYVEVPEELKGMSTAQIYESLTTVKEEDQ
jgi:Fe2+ or Zn2+ uptake regulation protein